MLSRASSLVYGRSPSVRHTCGYTLANKGRDTRAIQGWLGHRSITSTACLHGAGAEPVQGLLAGLNMGVARTAACLGTFFRSSRCALQASGWSAPREKQCIRNSLALFATHPRSSIRKRVNRIASCAAAAERFSQHATNSVGLLKNMQRCRPADARQAVKLDSNPAHRNAASVHHAAIVHSASDRLSWVWRVASELAIGLFGVLERAARIPLRAFMSSTAAAGDRVSRPVTYTAGGSLRSRGVSTSSGITREQPNKTVMPPPSNEAPIVLLA
jgi:hypothetical protein